MSAIEAPVFSVSDFTALCNQSLGVAFNGVIIEGEVSGFKINQNKYVFFDLKDEKSTVNCFMMRWQLSIPLEDGMTLRVRVNPKLTDKGRFSLTVNAMQLVGEGDLKKAFERLKKKLSLEGLFAPERKRPLPAQIKKIAVISSVQAAGYMDFCKILNERWGGLEVCTAHVQVQGLAAPEQIIRALDYFNQKNEVDVIALIRGGGSAEDLAAFNDEALVRALAASKIPVITGIGHEVDESLCDLAADFRASTPSNVAQVLTRDKREVLRQVSLLRQSPYEKIIAEIERRRGDSRELKRRADEVVSRIFWELEQRIKSKMREIAQMNPKQILARGYAILRGEIKQGALIQIETASRCIDAEIKNIKEKADVKND